jgi:hypothetical protein
VRWRLAVPPLQEQNGLQNERRSGNGPKESENGKLLKGRRRLFRKQEINLMYICMCAHMCSSMSVTVSDCTNCSTRVCIYVHVCMCACIRVYALHALEVAVLHCMKYTHSTALETPMIYALYVTMQYIDQCDTLLTAAVHLSHCYHTATTGKR